MSDKPRMAPQPDAPPGLEQDGKGHPIPFHRRTRDDQEKVREAVADAMHAGTKNPDQEAEIPAPSPDHIRGEPGSDDPEGHQGGQRRTGEPGVRPSESQHAHK